MKKIMIALLVGLVTFTVTIENADARRFGGGASMGHYSRSSSGFSSSGSSASQHGYANQPGARASQSQRNGQAGAMAQRRSSGLLPGLLAGGLLGALFFGGAFHGIQFGDILIIAVIAFGIYWFMSRRRTSQARSSSTQQANQRGFSAAPGAQPQGAVPAWFNRDRFLDDAKQHFTNLQKAWDANNLDEIQTFVTPELYNLLKAERAKQPSDNQTEIVRLFAELGNVQQFGQQAEASVLFHGVIRENGQQSEFNELWHLKREVRDQSPWFIQGIEQR